MIGRVQVDESGTVFMAKNATFMSDPDDIIRYHAGGVTVSRMEDTIDLVRMHDAFYSSRGSTR